MIDNDDMTYNEREEKVVRDNSWLLKKSVFKIKN